MYITEKIIFQGQVRANIPFVTARDHFSSIVIRSVIFRSFDGLFVWSLVYVVAVVK